MLVNIRVFFIITALLVLPIPLISAKEPLDMILEPIWSDKTSISFDVAKPNQTLGATLSIKNNEDFLVYIENPKVEFRLIGPETTYEYSPKLSIRSIWIPEETEYTFVPFKPILFDKETGLPDDFGTWRVEGKLLGDLYTARIEDNLVIKQDLIGELDLKEEFTFELVSERDFTDIYMPK